MILYIVVLIILYAFLIYFAYKIRHSKGTNICIPIAENRGNMYNNISIMNGANMRSTENMHMNRCRIYGNINGGNMCSNENAYTNGCRMYNGNMSSNENACMNGGRGYSNADIVNTLMTRRYESMLNVFTRLGMLKMDFPFTLFLEENKQYRNEIETFINQLPYDIKEIITHHSAGDKFSDTLNNIKEYYILDDTIGFNNLLMLSDESLDINQYYKLCVVPYFISNEGAIYELVAVITKEYKPIIINCEEYSYPLIVPNYDEHKKSFPYYLHAFYRKTSKLPALKYQNDYTRYIISKSERTYPTLYKEPKYRVYPHYGAACVFNTFMALITLCGDELISLLHEDIQKVIKDPNSNTCDIERKYIQKDINEACFSETIFKSEIIPQPYMMYSDSFSEISSKTKWIITSRYNGTDDLSKLNDAVASSGNYMLIGSALCVSRVGNWCDFFHQIGFTNDGYILDDMTYNPKPIDMAEMNRITLKINYVIIKVIDDA